mgnify:CR=1 FL=1
MADWTTIPDSSIEPGKPIRSIDGLALRDNPIAAFEGASGAPRLADAALGPAASATTAGRDWVLARTALADVGAVGTYAFLKTASAINADIAAGATRAGSELRYAGVTEDGGIGSPFIGTSSSPAGTWRCMGFIDYRGQSGTLGTTLWLRIA